MFTQIIHRIRMKISESYRHEYLRSARGQAATPSQEPDSLSQGLTHETRAFPHIASNEALPGDPDRHDRLNWKRGYQYGVGSLEVSPSFRQARDHFAMSRGGYFFDGYKRALAQPSGAGS